MDRFECRECRSVFFGREIVERTHVHIGRRHREDETREAPPCPDCGADQARKTNLMMAHECANIRSDAAKQIGNTIGSFHSYSIEYGAAPHIAFLTRPSICRCCGQRMARGTKAIKFMYDYTGCGSWTATSSAIHAEHCEAVNK